MLEQYKYSLFQMATTTGYNEPPIDYSDNDSDDYYFSRSHQTIINSQQQPMMDLSRSQLPTIDYHDLLIKDTIGQGGFGKVYRGKWNRNNVAIKEAYKQSVDMNQAIIKEANIHFNLNHPNIIRMFGISKKNGKILLVMEYARGGSLRDILTEICLPPSIIIKFAIQISSAMEYLHEFKPKPIIHRDLKSLNILLNEPFHERNWQSKQIKLTDLGLAREFSHSAQMSQCGTYAWMAPESITESKFSKASDVWSFGVVLWELLTGQIPYRDFQWPATAFGIGKGTIRLPIPKTCPEELKFILTACWNNNPASRPSFSQIKHQLEQSSFNVLNMEQFKRMKQNWLVEIDNIWNSLKEKEKELESREKEAKRKEKEVERIKQKLLIQHEELKRREIEVVGRELTVLMQQQQNEFDAGKRKRKSKRPPFVIGHPNNFRHNFTVMSSQVDMSAIPALQARQLNRTWGPGAKVRPELTDQLFTKSIAQNMNNEENDEYNEPFTKVPKKKKLGKFLRRIFRPSKTSLNRCSKECEEEEEEGNVEDGDQDDYDDTIEYYNLQPSGIHLNRTYHGQTKHSERQILDIYKHFLDPALSDYTDDDDNDNYEQIQYGKYESSFREDYPPISDRPKTMDQSTNTKSEESLDDLLHQLNQSLTQFKDLIDD